MPTALVVPREMTSMSSPRLDALEGNTSSSASNSEYGLSRRDTEQILDYYQSEDAGRTYVDTSAEGSYPESHSSRREHQMPPASAQSAMRPSTSSSVGRDSNGNPGRVSMESVASSSGGVQRRTSQRSAGGADKRRLAIMELDTPTESHMSASQEQRLDTSNSLPLGVTLLSRRGVDNSRLSGLALVGPPDAQPLNFAGLSPIPASAPATGVPPAPYQETRTQPSHSGHQRSLSEAPSPGRKANTKTSPRDVGIVGTLGSMRSSMEEQTGFSRLERPRPSTSEGHSGAGGTLTAPVFQTPRSRSPSPLPLAGVPPSADSAASETSLSVRGGQQLSPSIGQEKDIGRPVVGPVILDLTSGQPIIGRSPHEPPTVTSQMDQQRGPGRLPFKPNQAGPSFLHYQPGLHSTAGPLPSPPRHILTRQSSLPPPRPPRVLSPPPRRNEIDNPRNPPKADLPDGSRTIPVVPKPPVPPSLADSDYSISAYSASSSGSDDRSLALSSSAYSEKEPAPKLVGRRDQTDKSPLRNGGHVREGAFPQSSVFLSHPSQSPPQNQHQNLDKLVATMGGPAEHEESPNLSSALPSSVAEPPFSKHPQQPALKREASWVSLSAESFAGGPDDTSPPSSYPSSTEDSTRVATATTAVGTDDGLINRRRASLPAPPFEPLRRTDSLPRTPSLLSMSRPARSQASSPLSHPPLPKKPPSSWPDVMNFSDVLAKKTAADRALAYAAKTRELVTEQTGLREWLLSVRKERRDTTPATVPHTTAAFRIVGKQFRRVSRNSMASEVTFPIRQDSYTATDLSPRLTADLSSPTAPTVTLPYPSLAHGVGIRKRSSRTFANDSSVASLSGSSRSLGGGFFASIGRKASLKKDRSLPPSSPPKLIPSRQAPQPPQPRPVKLGAPPTLPGGPRAPARSTQRAQSVIFKSPEPPRTDGQVLSMPARPAVESTAAIDRQVGKLSDLLPQANKEILAGYLRRAHNQDPMSAIGTYLEDEKQGCLRHD